MGRCYGIAVLLCAATLGACAPLFAGVFGMPGIGGVPNTAIILG